VRKSPRVMSLGIAVGTKWWSSHILLDINF